MKTGDECDHCGRRIRFVASRAACDPTKQFCGTHCRDRYQREADVWAASRAGATVAELGDRFNIRREKVTQILAVHRARHEAEQVSRVEQSKEKP